MEPPSPPQEVEMRDVFTHFGQASMWSQALEAGVGSLLLIYHAVTGVTLTPEELSEKRRRIHDDTLGVVIREVKKHIEFGDPGIVELLDAALKGRNRLHHGFFNQRVHQLQTASGRRAVVAEIEELRGTFERADECITALLGPARKALGVSDEAAAPEL